MSKIILSMDDEVVNNKLITFTAPCESCGVTAVTINGVDYTLKTSTGAEISECGKVFVAGAKVTLSMCTDNNCAFVVGSGSAARAQIGFAGGSLDLIDNAEYRATGEINSLSLSYPDGNFECWISFIAGSDFSMDYPAETIVCGTLPEITGGSYYEISVKDKALIMVKGGIQ